MAIRPSVETARRNMLLSDAKFMDGWLCLKAQPSDAMKFLCKFKQNKNYEITLARQKRSLDANAYMWVLLDKISAEVGVPKEELYQRQIRMIGGVSDTLCIQNKAVDKFRKEWESKGIGWQTETIPVKTAGCTGVIVYYGSSAFDTKQMSRLIDSIVQDCQAMGIETKSDEEIKSLLKEWGKS